MSLLGLDLHRSCRQVETNLRSQVEDLKVTVDTLYEKMEASAERAAERERELIDRLVAFTNPGAYTQFARSKSAGAMLSQSPPVSKEAAQPLPLVNRETGRPIMGRVGVKPMLEPVPRDYRRVLKTREEMEMTAKTDQSPPDGAGVDVTYSAPIASARD